MISHPCLRKRGNPTTCIEHSSKPREGDVTPHMLRYGERTGVVTDGCKVAQVIFMDERSRFDGGNIDLASVDGSPS